MGMTFDYRPATNEKDAISLIGKAFDSSVTFFDTAEAYSMKSLFLILLLALSIQFSNAQNTSTSVAKNISKAEQELLDLSRKKWQWMADKNADTLASFFHDKSVFVHMGGSWGKQRELDIIKSGGIWYKKADILETSVNIIGNTAILLNRITLLAVVGGNEVTNQFMVTEIYIKENQVWELGALSFTKLMTPGQ